MLTGDSSKNEKDNPVLSKEEFKPYFFESVETIPKGSRITIDT